MKLSWMVRTLMLWLLEMRRTCSLTKPSLRATEPNQQLVEVVMRWGRGEQRGPEKELRTSPTRPWPCITKKMPRICFSCLGDGWPWHVLISSGWSLRFFLPMAWCTHWQPLTGMPLFERWDMKKWHSDCPRVAVVLLLGTNRMASSYCEPHWCWLLISAVMDYLLWTNMTTFIWSTVSWGYVSSTGLVVLALPCLFICCSVGWATTSAAILIIVASFSIVRCCVQSSAVPTAQIRWPEQRSRRRGCTH